MTFPANPGRLFSQKGSSPVGRRVFLDGTGGGIGAPAMGVMASGARHYSIAVLKTAIVEKRQVGSRIESCVIGPDGHRMLGAAECGFFGIVAFAVAAQAKPLGKLSLIFFEPAGFPVWQMAGRAHSGLRHGFTRQIFFFRCREQEIVLGFGNDPLIRMAGKAQGGFLILLDQKLLPADIIAMNFVTALADNFSVAAHAGSLFNKRVWYLSCNRFDVDHMKRLFTAVRGQRVFVPMAFQTKAGIPAAFNQKAFILRSVGRVTGFTYQLIGFVPLIGTLFEQTGGDFLLDGIQRVIVKLAGIGHFRMAHAAHG